MALSDGPLMNKVSLWRESSKGIKSRFMSGAKDPAVKREDIDDVLSSSALRRGDPLQKARLRFYPSIDVDHDTVFAGKYDGDISELEDKLLRLGARNNPTAYVEVTDKNGPDNGSYSILLITESGSRFNVPRARSNPGLFRRVKDQIHIVLWEVSDGVEIGAHREQHAWLQPARHVSMNDADARKGVRDFRDRWFDEFGEELPGKDKVMHDTTH